MSRAQKALFASARRLCGRDDSWQGGRGLATHKAPSGHSLGQLENPTAQRDISYDDLDRFRYYTIGPACALMFRFALCILFCTH